MVVSVQCRFPVLPGVDLQCVILAFPGHTHLLFAWVPIWLCTVCIFRRLSCADPESCVRGGPTLTCFFFVLFLVDGIDRGSNCH